MNIRWSEVGRRTARRFMDDQDGMKAIATAVAALRENSTPPEAFPWGRDGDYRLRVGPYRVMYRVKPDVIYIGRVDRTAG